MVVANLPLEMAESPLRERIWGWLALTALAMTLAILLALFVGRRVAKPLSAAAEAASALGQGDPVKPLPSSLREANAIGTALLGAADAKRQLEERQNMLISELNHRVKNLLMVVSSLVSRTLLPGRSVDEARTALTARISALARAHETLSESEWKGAAIADIVRTELAPFSDRAKVGGPDVTVNPRMAQNLVLVLHELATNASKYGALSKEGGSIEVSWTVNGNGSEAYLSWRWQERGGPPVTVPKQTGFGSTLLERVDVFGGRSPKIVFAPSGLIYSFEIPLADVVPAEPVEG